MTRLPDWEDRLAAYIEAVREKPFRYGEHDCILHACAAADAMTGEDWAAQYRGAYDSAAGAARALKKLGQGTLLRTIDAKLERKSPGFAQRGDFVWFSGSVGVCLGTHAAFVGEERLNAEAGLPVQEGLIGIPRAAWQKAWSV